MCYTRHDDQLSLISIVLTYKILTNFGMEVKNVFFVSHDAIFTEKFISNIQFEK